MSFGSPYFTLPEFTYLRARRIEEVLQLLEEKGEDARLLAGGVGLISFMKERLVSPSIVIDIKGIEELRGIKLEGSKISIGACTTLQEISENELIRKEIPALHQASGEAADIAIRGRATIGGNVCEAIPWVDMPVALLALDADIHLLSRRGERMLKVGNFLKGMLETDLRQNELVTKFTVPTPKRRSIFRKYAKGSEFAIASISICVDGEVRVVYGSVAPTPVRCKEVEQIIEREGISESSIRKASKVARESVECMDDVLASSAYRKHIVGILTASALKEIQR